MRRRSQISGWLALIAGLLCFSVNGRAEKPSFEDAAVQARRSIVTVRVALPIADKEDDPLAEPEEPRNRVMVCTGIAVGKHLVVTSAFASADATIRVTTPMGGRGEAKLRVIDEYSGLMLIETPTLELSPIPRSEKAPAAGQWVLLGAGWGAEAPVVTFGVVSGVDRQQPGYPPLLQCDVRTVETASGAAVLDLQGKLQGVVVAIDMAKPQGLTFAVPTRHVDRLLRTWSLKDPAKDAAKDAAKDSEDDQEPRGQSDQKTEGDSPPQGDQSADSQDVVILRRGRPEAGMVLQGKVELAGEPQVVVQRVRKGSPAQRAGFAVGDEILSVDGVQIRSVYEAVRPVLSRQPGDTLTYRIRNAKGTRDVTLVLGGGVAVSSPSLATVSTLIQPKIEIEGLPNGIRTLTKNRFRNFAGADDDNEPPKPTSQRQTELLQRAVDGYQKVIALQQEELRNAKEARERDQAMLEELRRQVEELKKQRP